MDNLQMQHMPVPPDAGPRYLKTTFLLARGFTLVELMVTLAIFAILVTIAVPSFSGLLIANRLTTQTNELVAALQLARSEAVKLNRSVTFCKLDSAASTGCSTTTTGNWSLWGIQTPSGIIRRGNISSQGGLVVSANLPATGLTFRADGLAYAGSGFANHQLQVWSCGNGRPAENRNTIDLGAGSRLALTKDSRGC